MDAGDDTTAGEDPNLYVEDMVWPPPHWGDGLSISPQPLPPGIIHGGQPQPLQTMPEYNVPGAVIGAIPNIPTLPDETAKKEPAKKEPQPPAKKGEAKRLAEQAGATMEETPIGAVPMAPDGMQPQLVPPQMPEVDAITGAAAVPPHTVSDELADQGATVRTEALPPNEQADAELADRLAADPQEFARWMVQHDQDQRARMQALQQKAIADDADAAAQHLAVYTAARQKAQADVAKMQDDAKVLAAQKLDPDLHQGFLGSLASFIGVTVGGAMSHWTGGRNLALEQYDKAIDDHMQAQRENVANQWKALGMRGDAIQQELASSGDVYRAQEMFRLGAYQRAQDSIQAETQNYDPKSTTVLQLAQQYQAIAARKQQVAAGLEERFYKLNKESAEAELARANANEANAKSAKLLGKLGGAGAGGATNPNYTVATGIFDPFTKEPILGKRQLQTKGEKSEERVVNGQITNYAHVQDDWARLQAIGAKIEYHKSLGEQTWSKWKTTDAAEYDAATHKIVVNLTKELGDKLTQGQLDEQGKRIPQRTGWLEDRDVGKMIADAQQESDQDFARDMNAVGINGDAIIGHAQTMRTPPPTPKPEEAADAAQQALARATTPVERKDAQAALDAAKQQVEKRVSIEQAGKAAVSKLEGMYPHKPYSGEDLPPELAAEVEGRNKTAETYNLSLKAAKKYVNTEPVKTDPKMKGDVAKAAADHEKELHIKAAEAVTSRAALDAADDQLAQKMISHLEEVGAHSGRAHGGIPLDKVKKLASEFGVDPKRFTDETRPGTDEQEAAGVLIGKLKQLDATGRQKIVKVLFGK